jgi:hypothetical protein
VIDMLRLHWGVLVLALFFSTGGWAASCDVGSAPNQPRPAWVSNPAQSSERFYGVGIAEIQGNALGKAVTEARANANAELAQSISVSIKSTIQSTESKLTENGKTAVKSNFETVLKSVSNIALKTVEVDGQWTDAVECRVWLRVSLSRAEAESAQKSALAGSLVEAFEAQMVVAENAARSVNERDVALAAATEVLNILEATRVPTFSMDGARVRLEVLQPALIEAKRIYATYRELLVAHSKAFAQMNAATAAAPKRIAAASALTGLQSLLAMAPTGMAGLPLPFDSKDRATALFTELGTPCSAQQWFTERAIAAPAQFKPAGTTCSAQDVGRERRQLYLAGRPVLLICTLNLDGPSKPWEKVCASMQEKLNRDGVVWVSSVPSQGGDAVHKLTVVGTGSIKKRVDADTQATLYRFEGSIASSFKGPNQVDIQDKFEGMTGWNPVSANMTTDVLAINVAARLDAAISRNWEK